MTFLCSLICLALIVLSFIAGLRLDNYYHTRFSISQKEALERQFMRLRAGMDADDPVRPYYNPQPISPDFMRELRAKGKAKTSFRKSDLAK